MRMQAFRWMGMATVFALSTGLLVAQSDSTARGSISRSPMGQLTPTSGQGERGSSVSGPTLGYVVDASTGNLHMVNGIAGSSIMGAPVHRGAAIRAAAISPAADYAVVADESGAVLFYGAPTPRGAAQGATLSGVDGEVSHLATSPSGDGFVLFSEATRSLAIFEVTGGVPRFTRSYSVSVGGSVSQIALADGGKDPILLTRDGSGSAIVRAGSAGVSTLAVLPGATDLAYLRGSEKAVILDASQNAVYEADLSLQNPALRLVASSAQGIDQPVGLALSEDNKTVAVASSGNRKAALIDLATSSAVELDLPEVPTGVRRMNSRAVFQLTDASNGPMLLLDVQGASARTVYVPVSQSARSVSAGRARLQE